MKAEVEGREDKIIRKHKKQLARQARALIADQAQPALTPEDVFSSSH